MVCVKDNCRQPVWRWWGKPRKPSQALRGLAGLVAKIEPAVPPKKTILAHGEKNITKTQRMVPGGGAEGGWGSAGLAQHCVRHDRGTVSLSATQVGALHGLLRSADALVTYTRTLASAVCVAPYLQV